MPDLTDAGKSVLCLLRRAEQLRVRCLAVCQLTSNAASPEWERTENELLEGNGNPFFLLGGMCRYLSPAGREVADKLLAAEPTAEAKLAELRRAASRVLATRKEALWLSSAEGAATFDDATSYGDAGQCAVEDEMEAERVLRALLSDA